MYINVPEKKQEEFHNQVKLAQAPLSSYKCPTTIEEYWWTVDNYWNYLLAIIEKYAYKLSSDNFAAIESHVIRLKEKRDLLLVHYFSATWAAAPDCGSIHQIPGWHVLCDLCSESYLVYEEKE